MAAPRLSETGIRLHQFILGALPVVAYLTNWPPAAWAALALSLLAVVSPHLLIFATLYQRIRPSAEDVLHDSPRGFYHFAEGVNLLLLACGIGLLATGRPLGWLPLLAASCIAIMAGTTGFSFSMLVYAILRKVALRLPRTASLPDAAAARPLGNPKCLVCRALAVAPYHRCHWCNLPSVRWCCGLQSSMLLVLLLVIAFLLNAMLDPWVTKVLVTMSILGVVALALAINRQTEDLVTSLDSVAKAQRQDARRCDLLQRLALANSVQDAAQTAVDFVSDSIGAGRISLMLVEDGALHIAASKGIPPDVASRVAVPIGSRICGRVFAEGTPIVTQDIAAEFPADALGFPSGGAASYPVVTAHADQGPPHRRHQRDRPPPRHLLRRGPRRHPVHRRNRRHQPLQPTQPRGTRTLPLRHPPLPRRRRRSQGPVHPRSLRTRPRLGHRRRRRTRLLRRGSATSPSAPNSTTSANSPSPTTSSRPRAV